jgi:hypothetical protein
MLPQAAAYRRPQAAAQAVRPIFQAVRPPLRGEAAKEFE